MSSANHTVDRPWGPFEYDDSSRYPSGRSGSTPSMYKGFRLAGAISNPDSDNDGIPDASDNCPSVSNADQGNTDGDGWGDEDPAVGVEAGTDCDDSDAELDPSDADGDGYSICDDDCDDVGSVHRTEG